MHCLYASLFCQAHLPAAQPHCVRRRQSYSLRHSHVVMTSTLLRGTHSCIEQPAAAQSASESHSCNASATCLHVLFTHLIARLPAMPEQKSGHSPAATNSL